MLGAAAALALVAACGGVAAGPPDLTGSEAVVVGEGPFIVVDRFGYRPGMRKRAVLRDPRRGFDADMRYRPGPVLELRSVEDAAAVHAGPPSIDNNGAADPDSGDVTWSFDFSAVTAPGTYVVVDPARGVRSPPFRIAEDVYDPVLRQAARAFFYQRAGFAKQPPHADPRWADGASHTGPRQDTEARLYNDTLGLFSVRDLHGGWYDAGDYNRYTRWTANYIVSMLHAYREAPAAWGDDSGLPESGNGLPDLIDEIRWGLAWLARMQTEEGGLLSVLGVDEASPPSAADGPSYYGPANTSATLGGAAAFAFAAQAFAAYGAPLEAEAEAWRDRALEAWAWAEANPEVVFRNNDPASGSAGLAAGQQEVDDEGRARARLIAAIHLFALTGEARFAEVADAGVPETELVAKRYADPFLGRIETALLHYASQPGVDPGIRATIHEAYVESMAGWNAFRAMESGRDPYGAPMDAYTWGSNGFKSAMGTLFTQVATYDIGPWPDEAAMEAGAGYIHYLHGVNPLGKVYLSNMGEYGVENSATEFYHAWFRHEHPLWGNVETSAYGPAPGFLVGGPNPSYTWDACCPASCGNEANNAMCGLAPPSPPAGQPPMKAYRDFGDGWPLNSWEVTENSNAYQVEYLRLLSKFVAR
ncbi:MAG: glycoside hydrolase family 9 protein [Azospirillaceae bacterium]